MDSETKPLASDPKRQANAVIGGFIYQAWQSVFSWIHLSDDEILFLEGAEDIDVLSQEQAIATQVKNKQTPITLRSQDVIQALSNFWILKEKEKRKRKIIFQLITPAPRGIEQGNPFNDEKGLDYWEKCKKGANVSLLRKFLQSLTGFPQNLVDFISKSSDEELLNELIVPFQVLTEEDNLEEIRKKVEDDLILIGNKLRYSADDSKRAAETLFGILLGILCKEKVEERKLGKADFLREFENATSIQIPKTLYQDLVARAQERQNLLPDPATILPSSQQGNKVSGPILEPHIVDKSIFIQRDQLIQQISQMLDKTSVVLIKGSSGMGKSILSLQVIEGIRQEWERMTFRGYDGKSIKEIMTMLCDTAVHKPSNIILDDLNFSNGYQIYADSFERLISLLIREGKKVLVTSQREIPPSLGTRLGLTKLNEFTIPEFSNEEIKKLLLLNSCPNADTDLWLKDLKITTQSHPQLVHARIRKLKEDGWDKRKIIFKTEELAKIRQETVKNLSTEIPSHESRDLLLRLSILTGSFRQKNALSLARYPTEIKTPGVFFAQLIGPYIEQVGEDYYSLSPLLGSAFQGNYSDKDVKILHELAGESYRSNTLTPTDLSNIFLHGIASGSGRIMSFAFSAFQSIQGRDKKLIYPHIDWLTAIHIGTDKMAFEEDEVMNFMFRHIQFTIAAETKDEKYAVRIADTWFKEAKSFTGKGPFAQLKEVKIVPFMFYASVFKYNLLQLPISKCVEWIIEAFSFLDKNPEANSLLRQPPTGEKLTWKDVTLEVALTKRINRSNIDEFMATISGLKGGIELLRNIDANEVLPRTIADSVWLDQIDKENPDWRDVLLVLEKLKEFALTNKAINVAAYVIRAIAIIKNEYLNDDPGAIKDLIEGIKILGKHPELINYQAKIAFIKHDYKTALKTWETVLSALSISAGLTASFSYKDAAVSAANLGDWNKATDYFRIAANIARRKDEIIFESQCLAEYGFALWKLKRYSDSLKIFQEVIKSFDYLPNPKDNLRVLGLLKMTSNALIYFRKTTNPEYRNVGLPYTEPATGVFSNLEFSKSLKELPIPPPSSLLTYIAAVEFELKIGDSAFRQLMTVYDQLPVLFQTEAKRIHVAWLVRSKNISSALDELLNFFALMNVSVQSDRRHELVRPLTTDDIDGAIQKYDTTIMHYVSFMLLRFVPIGAFSSLPINELSAEGKKLGLDKSDAWNSYIEFISKLNLSLARKTVNSAVHGALRTAAAIYILIHDEDRDFALCASTVLVTQNRELIFFHKEIENNLADLIAKKWSQIASGLYELYHEEDAKKVLDICSNKKVSGLRKASQIIIAAKDISFMKIDSMLTSLNDLAKKA